MTDRPQFWQNETGAIHLVDSVRPSDNPMFESVIRTKCGLEYNANSPAWEFDPDKPAFEQTTYPRPEAAYCGRCPWDEVMG